MESFIIVASLVSELARGGQNDKKHLSPLRVKAHFSLVPQSNAVFQFEVRFYLIALAK